MVAECVDSSTWSKACAKSLAPAVRDQVSPQQLAVAVPGGEEVMIWGLRVQLEVWEEEAQEGGQPPKGLLSDDEINARNSLDRKKTSTTPSTSLQPNPP